MEAKRLEEIGESGLCWHNLFSYYVQWVLFYKLLCIIGAICTRVGAILKTIPILYFSFSLTTVDSETVFDVYKCTSLMLWIHQLR